MAAALKGRVLGLGGGGGLGYTVWCEDAAMAPNRTTLANRLIQRTCGYKICTLEHNRPINHSLTVCKFRDSPCQLFHALVFHAFSLVFFFFDSTRPQPSMLKHRKPPLPLHGSGARGCSRAYRKPAQPHHRLLRPRRSPRPRRLRVRLISNQRCQCSRRPSVVALCPCPLSRRHHPPQGVGAHQGGVASG